MSSMLPSVGVVLPAHDRTTLLIEALSSIKQQDYAGDVRVLVVYDRKLPSQEMQDAFVELGVDWMSNNRAPGPCGARNSGAVALDTDLLAFCDDDDRWHREKLSLQVAAMQRYPNASVSSTGIVIENRGKRSVRHMDQQWVHHADFTRYRYPSVHTSTLVVRRDRFIELGLFDEEAPQGQNEDWDFLLRATREQPVLNLTEPLVDVVYGQSSYFSHSFEKQLAGIDWILAQHPDLAANRQAAARFDSQRSFYQACLGLPGAASLAVRSLAHDVRGWRSVMALLITAHVVSPETILRSLHYFGRGA